MKDTILYWIKIQTILQSVYFNVIIIYYILTKYCMQFTKILFHILRYFKKMNQG